MFIKRQETKIDEGRVSHGGGTYGETANTGTAMCVCRYVCMNVCIYVCMYVRMYVSMYEFMYVCVFGCMFVCVYVFFII